MIIDYQYKCPEDYLREQEELEDCMIEEKEEEYWDSHGFKNAKDYWEWKEG